MKKVLTVVGARPQFIKAAMLSKAFKDFPEIEEVMLHTGQHYDANMSDIFFKELEIPLPKYHFAIQGLSHGAMTGRMMESIEEALSKEKPDAVVVYGDTNSTFAGAYVAAKHHIPVIHIEAGLRSFNMKMPEEINRILTDQLSTFLFCPTQTAVQNLIDEGFNKKAAQIAMVGDIMEDAALYFSTKKIETPVVDGDYILFTCHRPENTEQPQRMASIIEAINTIAEDKKVLWPVHPRLKNRLGNFTFHKNVVCVVPMGYLQMLQSIKNANLVITDSGGLQKEAYFFNKYCLTIRDETEWVELVEYAYNVVVGADTKSILKAYNEHTDKEFVRLHQLYGGGKAAQKIASQLVDYLLK